MGIALSRKVIGERSEPTECSCQSRFMGGLRADRRIGRNFETFLRRRGIVNGMSAQKLTECACSKHNFLATTGLATKLRILAS